jgi:hypothetical protein
MVRKIRCQEFERFTHFEPPEYEKVVFCMLFLCVYVYVHVCICVCVWGGGALVACVHTTLVTKQMDFIHIWNHPPNLLFPISLSLYTITRRIVVAVIL